MFTADWNICPPCTSEGKDYPMHGRIRTTPAEHLSADAVWTEEGYTMTVSGEMREAELFGGKYGTQKENHHHVSGKQHYRRR